MRQIYKNILSNFVYMSDVCSSYWDTGYDDELIDDRIAMNLLYIQVGLGIKENDNNIVKSNLKKKLIIPFKNTLISSHLSRITN